MTRAGRELEQLVECLEGILSAAGVTITSPDHIMGRESGTEREVDVSLRARIGSTEVLVIFECRDRGAHEDVTWLDELAGKRGDVGAHKVVAVSSSGFSPAAQRKAAKTDIELRLIRDITAADVFEWLSGSEFLVDHRYVTVKSVAIGVAGLPSGVSVEGGWNDPILRRCSDSRVLSLSQLWHQEPSLPIGEIYHNLIPAGAGQVDDTVEIVFVGPPAFEVRTSAGYMPITELHVAGTFSVQRERISIDRLHEYLDADGRLLVQTAEVRVQHEGQPLVFRVHNDRQTGSQRMSFTARTEDDSPVPPFDLNVVVESLTEPTSDPASPETADHT